MRNLSKHRHHAAFVALLFAACQAAPPTYEVALEDDMVRADSPFLATSVAEMPAAIHASSGAPEMLEKGVTTTRSTEPAVAAGCPAAARTAPGSQSTIVAATAAAILQAVDPYLVWRFMRSSARDKVGPSGSVAQARPMRDHGVYIGIRCRAGRAR